MVYSVVLAACDLDGRGFGSRTSTNGCGYICDYVDQKGLAAILTSIQSAGVAPEVNLRITQARKYAKWIHLDFETQVRCHQKSKTGVSMNPRVDITRSPTQGYQLPHEKELCPPKIFLKRN